MRVGKLHKSMVFMMSV